MFDRIIGSRLLQKELITNAQLSEIYATQEHNCAKLGVIAVSEKLMTIAQAEEVNMLQAQQDRMFGDLAIERGYLTQPQLNRILDLQTNHFLAFVQAVVDSGALSLAQINEQISEYQDAKHLSEADILALKNTDIDRCVPLFVQSEQERFVEMFTLGIKNLYRLVDNRVYIGEAYEASVISGEALGRQTLYGAENATVVIASSAADLRKAAIAYTKEELIETAEDSLDAMCELINCINGLYATQKSYEGVKIELEPPIYRTGYTEVSGEDMLILPVYIAGGKISYGISLR